MTTTVRAIIFDLGNTLMALDRDADRAAQQGALDMAGFLVSKGLAVEPDLIAGTFLAQRASDWEQGRQIGEEQTCSLSLLRCLASLGAPEKFTGLVAEAVRIYFAPEEAGWTAYPGAVSVLRTLYGQYRLGVLSNATDDGLIQRLVNRLGFRPWLAPVFTSAYLGFRKPRSETFLPLLDAWKLHPEEVVMVGDRLDADILGARTLGLRSVLITADEPADNDACRQTIVPDAVIAAIDDLPALLGSWRS